MAKKAEISGEIFIYILAIVIFALTLLYGYKAISFFNQRGQEISYAQMYNDIKQEIEKVEGDTFGTVKKYTIDVPGPYQEVCFVNSKGREPRSIPANYTMISDTLQYTDDNMFLYPPGDQSYNVGDIEIISGQNCVKLVSGKADLRLESLGDHVKVSPWN